MLQKNIKEKALNSKVLLCLLYEENNSPEMAAVCFQPQET